MYAYSRSVESFYLFPSIAPQSLQKQLRKLWLNWRPLFSTDLLWPDLLLSKKGEGEPRPTFHPLGLEGRQRPVERSTVSLRHQEVPTSSVVKSTKVKSTFFLSFLVSRHEGTFVRTLDSGTVRVNREKPVFPSTSGFEIHLWTMTPSPLTLLLKGGDISYITET